MKVAILAGGLGTRLVEETERKPKPMVEIGSRPILWHIMKGYGSYGFNEFLIALGYLGDVVKRFFLDYSSYLTSDLTISLGTGEVSSHGVARDDWLIDLIDTGPTTQTGGRLKRLSRWIGQETFLMTYGDGLSDVNIRDLVRFHREHGRLATMTAVRPPARFGALGLDGDRVAEFAEKPQAGEGWINGGFFVLEPAVLDYIEGDETILEREPLERLAAEGELFAYRHHGYWQSMDTLRDVRLLNAAWASGEAPWKVWAE
jgi:glucose-1-phosphate cytidylyltransferase